MIRSRLSAVLVAIALAGGAAVAASPAAAAPAACAKQAKAVTTAKKKLKKAKTAKAKKAAKKQLTAVRKKATSCKKATAKPAPAPAATPPAAPAPPPAPTTNILTVDPATPSTAGPITVTLRAPTPAPVPGEEIRLQILVPGGDREQCAAGASHGMVGSAAGANWTFYPLGVPPSSINTPSITFLKTWCAGPATATAFIRSASLYPADNGTPIATTSFSIQ